MSWAGKTNKFTTLACWLKRVVVWVNRSCWTRALGSENSWLRVALDSFTGRTVSRIGVFLALRIWNTVVGRIWVVPLLTFETNQRVMLTDCTIRSGARLSAVTRIGIIKIGWVWTTVTFKNKLKSSQEIGRVSTIFLNKDGSQLHERESRVCWRIVELGRSSVVDFLHHFFYPPDWKFREPWVRLHLIVAKKTVK